MAIVISETIVHTVGNLYKDRKYSWRKYREGLARLESVNGNMKRLRFFVLTHPEYKLKFEWNDGRASSFNIRVPSPENGEIAFKFMSDVGYFNDEEMAAIRRTRDAILDLVVDHAITEWDTTWTY